LIASRDQGMNRRLLLLLLVTGTILHQCKVVREITKPAIPTLRGIEGLAQKCESVDTIRSYLVSKAEAILSFDDERYEVTLTLYSKKDSIIYLSAVNSGYEIIRASVENDSIKVINRLNKIVYTTPLSRRFGYQYPINFDDLQNILTGFYLCDDMDKARDDMENQVLFEFDETYVKKRISIDRNLLQMDTFEFYHQQTNEYLMGERIDNGFKIYSNFMISEFEIVARGGSVSFNRDIKVKMDVNPRKYTFTELR